MLGKANKAAKGIEKAAGMMKKRDPGSVVRPSEMKGMKTKIDAAKALQGARKAPMKGKLPPKMLPKGILKKKKIPSSTGSMYA